MSWRPRATPCRARSQDLRRRRRRVRSPTIPRTLTLRFTVANVPADLDEIEQAGGLAEVLHQAVSDPNARRLQVVYVGVKPDLLRHEAQAILTGRIGDDGVFEATELLLKCPTRYEEEVPLQSSGA